jgi:hypothetical protein
MESIAILEAALHELHTLGPNVQQRLVALDRGFDDLAQTLASQTESLAQQQAQLEAYRFQLRALQDAAWRAVLPD